MKPVRARVAHVLVAVMLAFASTACESVTDPYSTLLVTGTVTQGGEPVVALIGLTARGFQSSDLSEPDGTYSITTGGGGVPESYCSSVMISASLLDEFGAVIDQDTRQIGACGEHTVDFDFP